MNDQVIVRGQVYPTPESINVESTNGETITYIRSDLAQSETQSDVDFGDSISDNVPSINPLSVPSQSSSYTVQVHGQTYAGVKAIEAYDPTSERYVSFGAGSDSGGDGDDGGSGKDGFSPIIDVTTITGGHRVSITDVNGTQSFDVMDGQDGADGQDGKDGQDGAPGTDGKDGAPGMDGQDGAPGVDGQDGAPGADGQDGFSPSASVERVQNGAQITITDSEGTTTATVYDGENISDDIRAAFPQKTISDSLICIEDGADNIPVKNLIVQINPVQAGSGDPSSSNVRSITGWTGAHVTRTGVNLFGGTLLRDGIKNSIPSAVIDDENKYINFSAGADISKAFTTPCGLTKKFKESTSYTFIFTIYKTSGVGSNLRIYYTDGTYINIPNVSEFGVKETVLLVTNNNKTVSSLTKTNLSGNTIVYYEECGVFEGALTVDDFVSYDGESNTFSWEDEAGAVYGGTLNVTTGLLTVTHGNITAYAEETLPGRWISSMDVYEENTSPTIGAQVVYELAEPVTYQLTAQKVTTLLGINNVWADTGDISLTYCVNQESYISDQIPIASDVDPLSLGTAAPGSSTEYSRADHIHPMPSASDIEGTLPSNGTSQQILWKDGDTDYSAIWQDIPNTTVTYTGTVDKPIDFIKDISNNYASATLKLKGQISDNNFVPYTNFNLYQSTTDTSTYSTQTISFVNNDTDIYGAEIDLLKKTVTSIHKIVDLTTQTITSVTGKSTDNYKVVSITLPTDYDQNALEVQATNYTYLGQASDSSYFSANNIEKGVGFYKLLSSASKFKLYFVINKTDESLTGSLIYQSSDATAEISDVNVDTTVGKHIIWTDVGTLTLKCYTQFTLTSNFTTPEQWGAVGDGLTNDTVAFAKALNSGKIVLAKNKYLLTQAEVTGDAVLICTPETQLIKRSASGYDNQSGLIKVTGSQQGEYYTLTSDITITDRWSTRRLPLNTVEGLSVGDYIRISGVDPNIYSTLLQNGLNKSTIISNFNTIDPNIDPEYTVGKMFVRKLDTGMVTQIISIDADNNYIYLAHPINNDYYTSHEYTYEANDKTLTLNLRATVRVFKPGSLRAYGNNALINGNNLSNTHRYGFYLAYCINSVIDGFRVENSSTGIARLDRCLSTTISNCIGKNPQFSSTPYGEFCTVAFSTDILVEHLETYRYKRSVDWVGSYLCTARDCFAAFGSFSTHGLMAYKCKFINCTSINYGSEYVPSPNPVGNEDYYNESGATDQEIMFVNCYFYGGQQTVSVKTSCSAIYRQCTFVTPGEINSGCRCALIEGSAKFYNCVFDSYSQIINRTDAAKDILVYDSILNTTGNVRSGSPVTFINSQSAGTLTLQNCTINGTGRVKASNIRFINCVFNNTPDSSTGGYYDGESGQAYATTKTEFRNCVFTGDLGVSDQATDNAYVTGCTFNSLVGAAPSSNVCIANCIYTGTLALSDNATNIRLINNTQIPSFNT